MYRQLEPSTFILRGNDNAKERYRIHFIASRATRTKKNIESIAERFQIECCWFLKGSINGSFGKDRGGYQSKKHGYGSVPPLTWSKDEFVKLINEPEDNDFIEFRRFLWEMHQCLQAVDVTLGVGPRVVKQIERYLCNFSSINESSEDEKVISFDIQLVQRIFTKIRGSEDKLRKLFITENGTSSALDAIFDKYSELSRFEKSRAALARKKEELKIYGYCI